MPLSVGLPPGRRCTRALGRMRIAAGLIFAYYLYAAAVATYCLARDETLSPAGRCARLVGVFALPFIGALFALRATAEVSPQSLPPRRWLGPLVPLVRVRSHTGDAFPGGHDQVQRAEMSQPGQTTSQL